MKVTAAIAPYFASVDKHLADYDVCEVWDRPEWVSKFVKFCAINDQDPSMVADVIVKCYDDECLPDCLLWLGGAHDVFKSL